MSKKLLFAAGAAVIAGAAILNPALRPVPKYEKESALKTLPYAQWATVPEGTESLAGVTRNTPEAYPGYNLFTNDDNEIYLMDMKGERVHTWRVPSHRAKLARILPDGRLAVLCNNEALYFLDRESRVLSSVDRKVHHEIALDADGSLLVPVTETEREFGNIIFGFGSVLRISPDGAQTVLWSEADHLEELRRHHKRRPFDLYLDGEKRARLPRAGGDYYHLNTVEVLSESPLARKDPRFAAGNYLLCFRDVDLVVILDRESLKIVWSWGPGVLDYPHTPTLLPSGNLLVFDNGTHRGWSRLLEIEPLTGRIVWEYGGPGTDFFSSGRGSAQRLPNGNTLVCESNSGRVFELAPNKSIVWEYWNPSDGGRRKVIYRMTRVSAQAAKAFV